ncbi:MAG: hypothetical protein WC539_05825 [Nitrospirota bacterium]
MTIKKKILITAGVLVLIVIAAFVLILNNLDHIVKMAIERYGSDITKTAVRVASVKIHLSSGEGEIAGLTIANPDGFSHAYAFQVGKISTRINPRTVTDPVIVVDEIKIASPQITYEMNPAFASNILVLKKNIKESSATSAKKPEQSPAKKSEKKIMIKKLIIENGKIDAKVAALSEQQRSIVLKRIELMNIGSNGGATAAQVGEQVLTVLLDEVIQAVGKAGIQQQLDRQINKGIDRGVRQLLGQ